MPESQKIKEILISLRNTAEHYYQSSFQLEPYRCKAILSLLVQDLQKMESHLGPEGQTELCRITDLVWTALEAEDWVLVRDYLHYELEPWLAQLAIGDEKPSVF
ncbi:MAG TPA: hypothetical protein PKA28_08900 [Methylomusa anaerophila]|uniref:DUF86 domain-containing protein n=1 Tax=Methylomusa anaerophila TaxID=1930071 RepID=A0A348AKW4_9FIRM|nr:hypothetical protein [Methylomusa anaerophila]BBB91712.1 hypothetical protein MAMMFC1_02396 [Methylomusa anaerophila]HML88553.1 hypothetical protein [Methylomusa anaerophila]